MTAPDGSPAENRPLSAAGRSKQNICLCRQSVSDAFPHAKQQQAKERCQRNRGGFRHSHNETVRGIVAVAVNADDGVARYAQRRSAQKVAVSCQRIIKGGESGAIIEETMVHEIAVGVIPNNVVA